MNNSITLITSLYKSEEYLKKYIRRIKKNADFLLKNNIDFEIVIIGNDSTVSEKQELEKFESLNKRIKIFYVSREPLYASWNRGVELAKNEILGFWNVDDIRYPQAIVDGIRLVKQGAELVYFPFIIKWYLNFLGFSVMVRKRTIHPPVFDREEFIHRLLREKSLQGQCTVDHFLFLQNLFIEKLGLLMNNLKSLEILTGA